MPLEMERDKSSELNSDEIDLLELFRTYVAPYWKKYIMSAFLFAFIFSVLSYTVTPKFEATVNLQVNSGDNQSSARGGLGGLAALAGVNMSSGNTDILFNTSYLESREVAEAFIQKEGLRKKLFYKKLNDQGEFIEGRGGLKSILSLLKKNDEEFEFEDEDVIKGPGPSKEITYKRFSKVFFVDFNKKDMSASVKVKWYDRFQAKNWANDYVKFINKKLKDKAIKESQLKIKYLESQLKANHVTEVQQSIYSLIETELKKIAVAESTDQYAFKVVQRAFLPERKVSPRRFMYLFCGGFFGLFLVFARVFLRVHNPKNLDG